MKNALKLIKQAKEGGAHAIKFQTYKADELASKFSPFRQKKILLASIFLVSVDTIGCFKNILCIDSIVFIKLGY